MSIIRRHKSETICSSLLFYFLSKRVLGSFHYSLVFKVIYLSFKCTICKDSEQQRYYSVYLSTRRTVQLSIYWILRIPRNCFMTRSGSQQHAISRYQGFDKCSHISTHCLFKINFSNVLSHMSRSLK
jgi:hypothetical protein